MLPDEIVQQLPEDIRGHSVVQRYNDLPSLVKSHIGLTEYQGKSIGIPGNDPKEIEEWKTHHLPKLQHVFADRMPPEKPDGYEFKIDGIDNEALKNDKVLAAFRDNAHKLGLSKSQASGLFEQFAKDILPQLIPPPAPAPDFEFVDKAEDVQALMKETFKAEATQRIDEYKKGVAILASTIPELKDILNEGVAPFGKKFLSLGDHPGMVKLITEIGRLTNPDFAGGGAATSDAALAAADEIADIRTNPANPKHALFMKKDKATMAYVEDLYKQTTGGR